MNVSTATYNYMHNQPEQLQVQWISKILNSRPTCVYTAAEDLLSLLCICTLRMSPPVQVLI